jgi:hypothetical protein
VPERHGAAGIGVLATISAVSLASSLVLIVLAVARWFSAKANDLHGEAEFEAFAARLRSVGVFAGFGSLLFAIGVIALVGVLRSLQDDVARERRGPLVP